MAYAQCADDRDFTDYELDDAGGPEPACRPKGKWFTNGGAEFLNSLCPNGQFPFPDFDCLEAGERGLLEEACTYGFNTFKESWNGGIFDRFKEFTVAEQRILAVVERKTLRFGKLLEKIPRKTFLLGDDGTDRFGLPLISKTGLDEAGLTRGLRALAGKGAIARVRADQFNGRERSNVFGVFPLTGMLQIFFIGLENKIFEFQQNGKLSATRGTALKEALEEELREHCGEILKEDQLNGGAVAGNCG
ncbi:hypothetical protein ACFHWW_08345 [Ensifer sp. P24N7]|uniref:hypothetical protein n=1 Tax=Sinorhizobium sp. P24N7 TaxID=3348358 RepID=UPI0035F47453